MPLGENSKQGGQRENFGVDIARYVSLICLGFLVVWGIFMAGLYSAYKENALYRLAFSTGHTLKTLIEEIPNLTGTRPTHFVLPNRYDGDGVTVNTHSGNTDLVMLSGFFGDNNGFRLIQRDGTVVASWEISVSRLFPTAQSFCRMPPVTDWNALTHGVVAQPDGSVIFSFESCGMAKLDRCGNVEWTTAPDVTHHSPTLAENGDILIAGGEYIEPGTEGHPVVFPFREPYWEDLIFRYTPEGERIQSVPMTTMFLDNGLLAFLTATNEHSQFVSGEPHMNEVSELSSALAGDFPMFEAGDLLLSMRDMNAIFVTDPTGTVAKWWHVGPWLRQHDPDFQPGGRITVFDNHTDNTPDGSRLGGSRIYEIDVASGETRVLYGGRPDQHFYTPERGTHQVLADGSIMVTETMAGRAFQVTPDGEITWEYVNRWDADRLLLINEATVYPSDHFTVGNWQCS